LRIGNGIALIVGDERMIQSLAKLNIPRDPLGVALVAWKAALIIATIITSIFSYLAAMTAESARCAGMSWIAGYRSDTSDFWALPLISLTAVVFAIIGASKPKVLELLRNYEEPVSWFGPIRITFAQRLLCGSVVVFFVILCGATAWAVLRYDAIVHYCVSATAMQ